MLFPNKNILRSSGVFFFYGLVFLLFSYPLVFHFKTQYIGIPLSGDSSSYVWSIWHFRYSIMHGLSPFETKLLFYPMGSSLIMHGFIPSVGIINLFLNNPILTLNIALLLSFAFSGLGVFTLLRYFKISYFLCFLGGFIYAFFPYKTAHLLEHFNLELTALIPYFILFFIKTFSFQAGVFLPTISSKKYFIYLTILSIISVFTDYYYSIYAFYFAVIFSLVNKFNPSFSKLKKKQFLLITLIIFIAGHFIIRGFVLLNVDDKGALWWSADVASLFVPGTNSYLYGSIDWVKNYPTNFFRYPESVEFVMFMGFSFLILTLLFFTKVKTIAIESNIKFMAISSFIFLMLCFPEFKFLGKRLFYNIFGLFYYIPFLNNVRTPSRYQLMFMMLFLPILMKVLDVLWTNNTYKKIIISLSLILFFEYYPRHYTFLDGNRTPLVYKQLKDLPAGAILPIPFGFRDGIEQVGNFNTNHFLYQTEHNKPIIGGYISRLSKENLTQFSDNKTVKELYSLMANKSIQHPQLNSFNLPVKYIVIEPDKNPVFENYIDTVVGQQLIRKTNVENYLLYELK